MALAVNFLDATPVHMQRYHYRLVINPIVLICGALLSLQQETKNCVGDKVIQKLTSLH